MSCHSPAVSHLCNHLHLHLVFPCVFKLCFCSPLLLGLCMRCLPGTLSSKDCLRPCEIVRIFLFQLFKEVLLHLSIFFSPRGVFCFLPFCFLYLHFEKNFCWSFCHHLLFIKPPYLRPRILTCVSIGSYPCLLVAQWYYRLALTPETRVLGRVLTERPSHKHGSRNTHL